jgi:hypothetical protein
MNSSTVTPACSKTPLSVPRLISRCIGTTQPRFPRRIIAWLPLCRLKTNPNRSKARRASLPETSGSLGMGQRRHLESRQDRPAFVRSWKLRKIKLSSFLQVGKGFLKCLPLCGRARLRIMSHQPIAVRIGIYNGAKIKGFLSHHFQNNVADCG